MEQKTSITKVVYVVIFREIFTSCIVEERTGGGRTHRFQGEWTPNLDWWVTSQCDVTRVNRPCNLDRVHWLRLLALICWLVRVTLVVAFDFLAQNFGMGIPWDGGDIKPYLFAFRGGGKAKTSGASARAQKQRATRWSFHYLIFA